MADNYLERKQEQLRHGPSVYRKDNPSLETLLHRLSAWKEASEPSYIVKQASLDALARASKAAVATLADPDMIGITTSEQNASICIACPEDDFILGCACLAACLKAAELGLKTRCERVCGSVTIIIFK